MWVSVSVSSRSRDFCIFLDGIGTGKISEPVLDNLVPKKVWKSVSKKIWYRKKYQNRSRRKFGAEKSLGENLVPKRVSEPVPFRFLGLLKSLPLDTSKMSTPGVIGNDNPSLATQCLAFIQTVVNQEIGFNSQLTSGSFSCSFDNNGKRTKSTSRTPRKVKHKLPSTRKRNAKRRQKFLETRNVDPLLLIVEIFTIFC